MPTEHRRTPDQCFSIASVGRLRTTAVLIAFVHVDGFVAMCPTYNLRTTSPTSSGWNIKLFFREKKKREPKTIRLGLRSFTDTLNHALKSGQRHLFEPHQRLVYISQRTVFCLTDVWLVTQSNICRWEQRSILGNLHTHALVGWRNVFEHLY